MNAKAKSRTAACIKDVMTKNPVTVDPSTTARELARILTDNEISGVPVVNGEERVIGVVSRTDLLQWIVTGGLGVSPDDWFDRLAAGKPGERRPEDMGIVEDFMSTEAVTAGPEEAVSTVAARMAQERIHRVIVVDEKGFLLGIVTSLDLLRVFPETV
jgi:CBS domain-containing protein